MGGSYELFEESLGELALDSKPIYKKGVAYHMFKCVDCGAEHLTQKTNGGQPKNPRCSACGHKVTASKHVGMRCSDEKKAKISASLMGHKPATLNPTWLHTEESFRKSADARRGKPSGKKGWKAPPETLQRMSVARTRFDFDAGELRELYEIQGLSATDIGRLKGCDNTVILKRLKRLGIPIRHEAIYAKQRWANPVSREQMTRGIAEKSRRPEFRQKIGQQAKERWADPEYHDRVRAKINTTLAQPEYSAKLSKRLKTTWADPTFKDKMLKTMRMSQNVRPNKPESALQRMLDELYPDEWKYTGDGSLIIGGLNPDFANVDGQKKLLEVYGDYWHSQEAEQDWKRSELGRMMVFKSFGYETLVIWEREFKDPEKVKAKLKQFHDMKVRHHK